MSDILSALDCTVKTDAQGHPFFKPGAFTVLVIEHKRQGGIAGATTIGIQPLTRRKSGAIRLSPMLTQRTIQPRVWLLGPESHNAILSVSFKNLLDISNANRLSSLHTK